MTNEDRANIAAEALELFVQQCYGQRSIDQLHPDDVETAVSDLICDLGHALRLYVRDYTGEVAREDLPFVNHAGLIDDLADRAAMHFREEFTLGWDEEE